MPDPRPWSQARWLVVDIEGNGYWPPDLVELAALTVTDGAPAEPRSWLVKPPRSITPAMRRINGLRDADVADRPPVAELAAEMVDALSGADVVVGHQVRTDLGVLAKELPQWEPPTSLDTLRLAKALVPGLESYRLGALVEHLALAPEGHDAHRAAGDTVVTARLLLALIGRMDGTPSVDDVLSLAARGKPPASPGQDTLGF